MHSKTTFSDQALEIVILEAFVYFSFRFLYNIFFSRSGIFYLTQRLFIGTDEVVFSPGYRSL